MGVSRIYWLSFVRRRIPRVCEVLDMVAQVSWEKGFPNRAVLCMFTPRMSISVVEEIMEEAGGSCREAGCSLLGCRKKIRSGREAAAGRGRAFGLAGCWQIAVLVLSGRKAVVYVLHWQGINRIGCFHGNVSRGKIGSGLARRRRETNGGVGTGPPGVELARVPFYTCLPF